ncbi:MAG: methyltransferase domain-containing protein [Deltaproteobacteria bacterium]|nr:methyltransferase domain-containing protein [Deltaproteobacteria bacterium]
MTQPQYLFGDADSAAQRLSVLARVYDESTRAFLSRAAGSAHFPLALDLGCGPGFTTQLIADTLRCDRIIGFDSSRAFVHIARANSAERVCFWEHDVTATPFPCTPADLVFSRFLLTHLHDPATQVAKWATQVERRGLLLLEETETIHTSEPVFARYLQVVETILAERSNHLYAGRIVRNLDSPGRLRSVFNEVCSVPVRNCDAARMFVLNLRTWQENEFVRSNYSIDSILDLEQALQAIGDDESCCRDIAWDLRQAAWSKD